MRYPRVLPPGGTVGFPAPSFGCAIEPYRTAFAHSLKRWEEWGYNTKPGPNAWADRGVGISNEPKACAEEFMEMYLSQDTDCLISCGGGELMCEILPFVDFDRLAQGAPKWFMGYSDNTNLTFLLATLADTASLYGPCAASFGMEPLHASLRDALELCIGRRHCVESYGMWDKDDEKDLENPLAPYRLTEPLALEAYLGGEKTDSLRVRGRLLGGCMDVLVNLTGTVFDRTKAFAERYREDGILWFLESCDLNVFGVRRAMWQMEQAGWFRHVKGFLIGRPANGQPMMGLSFAQAVLEVAGKKNVPVILGADIGHRPPMMPLVTGSLGDVTLADNHLKVEMTYR